jgi:hypothetical protein
MISRVPATRDSRNPALDAGKCRNRLCRLPRFAAGSLDATGDEGSAFAHSGGASGRQMNRPEKTRRLRP